MRNSSLVKLRSHSASGSENGAPHYGTAPLSETGRWSLSPGDMEDGDVEQREQNWMSRRTGLLTDHRFENNLTPIPRLAMNCDLQSRRYEVLTG